MPNKIRDISESWEDVDNDIFIEKNVSIPMKDSAYPIRCNIYRPLEAKKSDSPLPAIMTYGPYGKDIPYSKFNPSSFAEIHQSQRSRYSAWETPNPVFWCRHGYAVVRCDERGFGQSPGYLDSMSADTADLFCQAIEWVAQQPWSTDKVGLLGVSYFAGTQWRVAARAPRGLACIIPWEGMSDYYRDRCRHGGILSDHFIRLWWQRQVITNQYGLPGRAARQWGDDTIEGDLPEAERQKNRCDQTVDNVLHHFRDEPYYASRDFRVEDIHVPLLSVANLGGIGLHLRGNVLGYMFAESKFKYLRFIVGRHDLPFYYEAEVELQRSFLDAWLKNEDRAGWTEHGKVAPVSLVLRTGNVGYNDEETERSLVRREEMEWPIARTKYTRYYLTSDNRLQPERFECDSVRMTYPALGTVEAQHKLQFFTSPFETETEITGHIVAHLCVSVSSATETEVVPWDMDLFVTMRHLDATGAEILYTGTVGDPVPVVKGWLRCSLRKVQSDHSRHRHYLPYREYFSADEEPMVADAIYEVDVEVWPTSVVVTPGHRLIFEVSSGDTDGTGLFRHVDQTDRDPRRFAGLNHIHFGKDRDNYIQLPIIRN
ncbi:X-Pro dipeptidyl-peptidase (S15 family) protein [Purpureocillium lavendulum]|uniref:X-Pro dipeptidyl-peptidase (S15 family) protein n=1 Tax=Purpureocillium lavendulum TaxID=1247861 RepID=A0AB34FI95_9HYPO|nr:X-Pro dipeptidyl-peptidase (S15 family) protein [Purpureocillium lavendulum]